jgi:rubrerythrin
MASISRKQLQKLKELAAQLDDCRTCGSPNYSEPSVRVVFGPRPGEESEERKDPEPCPTCGHTRPVTRIRWGRYDKRPGGLHGEE